MKGICAPPLSGCKPTLALILWTLLAVVILRDQELGGPAFEEVNEKRVENPELDAVSVSIQPRGHESTWTGYDGRTSLMHS